MKQNSHSAISALLPTFHRMQSFQSLSADLIVQSFALDPHASYPTATSRRRLTVIKLQDNVTVCKVIQVKLAIVKMEFIIATLRLLFVENQQQHVTAGTNTIDKTLIAKIRLSFIIMKLEPKDFFYSTGIGLGTRFVMIFFALWKRL